MNDPNRAEPVRLPVRLIDAGLQPNGGNLVDTPHACEALLKGPDGDGTEVASLQADEVRESLARISGTGTAARGDVRVTVAVGGRLSGVVIGGAAMALSGAALAAEIMTAASLANMAVAREVHSVASRFYPEHEIWRSLV